MRSFYTIILLFVSFILSAQSVQVNMPNVRACQGDTVLVAVNGQDLNNLGTIELHILYDTSTLEYISLKNGNPLIQTPLINDTLSALHYAALALMSPMNLGTAKLFDLEFLLKGGNSNLHFIMTPPDVCSLTDFSTFLPVPNVTYTDGSITDTCIGVGMQETIRDEISVFPNPSDGLLHIMNLTSFSENYTVEIYSASGILLRTFEVDRKQDACNISLSGLSKGLLLLHFRSDEINMMKKIIHL